MRKFIAGLIVGLIAGFWLAFQPRLWMPVRDIAWPSITLALAVALVALVVALRALWKGLRKTSTKASNVLGLIAAVVVWVNREALTGLVNADALPWLVISGLVAYLVADKLPRSDPEPEEMPARTPRGGGFSATPAPPAISRRSRIVRHLGNRVKDDLNRAGIYFGLLEPYPFEGPEAPRPPIPTPPAAPASASVPTPPAAPASGTNAS